MSERGILLIVDDNPNNLQVLGGMLEQHGYSVRPALSGLVALRAVEASLPDLILLDIRMPGIDGYETCRRLKANPRTRNIPVIFISAMQDLDDKLAAFQAGGVDYVPKPFQEEEVLARVAAHIDLHRIKNELQRRVDEQTRELKESEARYRVLFEGSPLAVMVYDAESEAILAVNAACTRMLGYSAEACVGKAFGFALKSEQRAAVLALAHNLPPASQEVAYTGPLYIRHADGMMLETEGIIQCIEYPGYRAQTLMLQDVTARRQAEERLRTEAKEHQKQLVQSTRFDALTGLPNRALFSERMAQGIEQTQRTGRAMAVCFLDIDAFKPLNETYGREVGDHLLINVAECLRRCLRGGDTLARLGGDEFALLLLGVRDDDEINDFLADAQAQLAEPFISDELIVSLTASIGVTSYPRDDSDPDTLLRHADHAMMQAKQIGAGRYQHFDPEGARQVRVRRETIDHMRSALQRREFVLFYQPKVDMQTHRVIGAEALIRWRHPERGLLPPGAFLPAIEGDAFMIELGDWVIGEALDQMARWSKTGLDLSVSVNVAAVHLVKADFVSRLQEHLALRAPMNAGRLEIEVLETSALDDLDSVEQIISACRALGVGFSLDDFGTGYASLTYLRRLSADTLKIDQSFVRSMLDDAEDRAIVSGVVGLAAAFRRSVIAEGVETLAHARSLLSVGCQLAQGYGIARPMPADDMPAWVSGWPHSDWLSIAEPVVEAPA